MEGTHEVGRRPFMPDSTLSRRSAALMGAWTRPPLLPKTHKFHTETAGEPIKTCIPARSNRTTTVPFSPTAYRRRHRIENFFERIKRYRRVATRYDKLAETFLGFICLAILFTLRLT